MLPNKSYERLFNEMVKHTSLEVDNWKSSQLLGYFVFKYKELYNKDYQFKFNTSASSKCFELFQINKLKSILSQDNKILYDYINWSFELLKKQSKKVRSISILCNEENLTTYKSLILSSSRNYISRGTKLPDYIMDIIKDSTDHITTYGELVFLLQMNSSNSIMIKEKLQNIKFDFNIINSLS